MKLIKTLSLLAALLGATSLHGAVFIANPSVTESSLSSEDVKNVLLGNKLRWAGGNVKLAVQPESPAHAEVIKTYTQRSPEQYDTFWKKLVFSGKGTMPSKFKSDAEVVEFVSKTPGGFGYVASPPDGAAVKVITIN